MKIERKNVWCLLGLPFDAVSMDEAIERLYEHVKNKRQCFLSTPNMNFLISAQHDKEFRNSVINSDLSVADGKPIIWIAKLLGIPIPERVAGSDLIEALIENKKGHRPLKVFFFGGQEGVAENACRNLNSMNAGLICAGYYTPGFGNIDEMSTPEIINEINRSEADFLIVSLGAKKGQAWIERNRDKLNVMIVSHLGAVINFIAGNVKRAPKLIQKLGLEWLWRIKEEPSLWKRYGQDGTTLVKLFLTRVIPLKLNLFNQKRGDLSLTAQLNEEELKITFNGLGTAESLDTQLQNLITKCQGYKIIILDLSNMYSIDSSFLGKLFVFIHDLKVNSVKKIKLIHPNNQAGKLLYYYAIAYEY